MPSAATTIVRPRGRRQIEVVAFDAEREIAHGAADDACFRSIPVPVPLPLALLNSQRHALAVNVGHLQVRDLGHAQARAVGDAERGFVLAARRRFEETRHFLLAQHDRRLARLVHGRQRANEVGPFERHGEKNRSAAMAALMDPGLICCCAICS